MNAGRDRRAAGLRPRRPGFGIAALFALAAAPVAAEGVAQIKDNSFLLEEAYNQDPRVVQHIFSWVSELEHVNWVLGWTDEWPLGGQRNQLSFTVPVQGVDDGGGVEEGVGDAALHYRRQWLGVEGGTVALASRLSALLPTGSESRGLGEGAVGGQFNLALSLEHHGPWVTHSNAGATWVASSTDHSDLIGFNLGQSLIWNVAPAFDLMLEAVYDLREPTGSGEREENLVLSPGFRWAYTARSGLQVVPGLAAPIGLGPSSGKAAALLYLSIEHGF